MGYYVPQKLPEDCRECPYNQYLEFSGDTACNAGEFVMQTDSKALPFEGRHHNCPLVEIPDGHGRLIDADAFDERVRLAGGMCEEELTEDFKNGVQTTLYMLSGQPTVIQADKEET